MPVALNRGIRVIPVRGSTEGSGHRLDPSRLETGAGRVERRKSPPGIYRLSFPRSWEFVPGQSVALTLDPRVPARFYSIASGTGDPQVDVLYDLVPEGVLTPRLAALSAGRRASLLAALRCVPGRDRDPPAGLPREPGSRLSSPWRDRERPRAKMLLHGSRTIAGLLERGFLLVAHGRQIHPLLHAGEGRGSV